MIQRIQSLFLLAVVLLSALLCILPVYDLKPADSAVLTVTSFRISGNALLMILNGAVGVFSLVALFLYSNRKLQMRLCNLNLLLTCILTGLLFFVADTMSSGMNQHVEYKYGSYLPLLQLLFLFLASRYIRRDEELVRSADRLR